MMSGGRKTNKPVPRPSRTQIEQRHVEIQASREVFIFPILPETLEKYEQVMPGLSKVMVDQWKAQTEHRQRLEAKMVDSGIQQAKQGMWMGLVIAIAIIVCAGYLGYLGRDLAAFGIVVGSIVPVATVFVLRENAKTLERERKAQIMAGTEPR